MLLLEDLWWYTHPPYANFAYNYYCCPISCLRDLHWLYNLYSHGFNFIVYITSHNSYIFYITINRLVVMPEVRVARLTILRSPLSPTLLSRLTGPVQPRHTPDVQTYSMTHGWTKHSSDSCIHLQYITMTILWLSNQVDMVSSDCQKRDPSSKGSNTTERGNSP